MANGASDSPLLRFAGERELPARPLEVARMRPERGTGERPAELDHELSSEIRPGRVAHRRRPGDRLEGLDPDAGFSGYRPPWLDMLPVPRALPRPDTPGIRRFSGRGVRPEVWFHPENRTPFIDQGYPWGAIGRVFSSNGRTGTGALVGRRLMVTVGHVVPWPDEEWWMRFVPGYFQGGSLHGVGSSSYVSDVDGHDPGKDAVGYDWALCRLYEPLGDFHGWFGYNGYDSDWEDRNVWTLVGYPGDLTGAEQPTYQAGIAVFDDDSDSHGGRELEHRGDTSDGMSGGPFFGWWNDDPRLIGVHAGAEEDVMVFPPGTELGNIAAGGSGFTNLIAWGRTNWT